MKITTILCLSMLSLMNASLLAGCGGKDTDSGTGGGGAAGSASSSSGGADDIHTQVVGHWVSKGCETRPGANNTMIFIKRDFSIAEAKWSGFFHFFTDATCATETSVAYSEGPYTIGERSAANMAGYTAEFVESLLAITPKDQATVDFLNSAMPGTCGTEAWVLDMEQDVTATSGCSVFGIDLKTCGTEHEFIKVENDELYFGARPADGGGLCTEQDRPTTFQVPLAKAQGR